MDKIKELFCKKEQNCILEISPVKIITKNIYDYTIHPIYFNQFLSQISKMKWDKIHTGEQYLYYLNNMILCVGKNGKQSCIVNKFIDHRVGDKFRLKLYKKESIDPDDFPPIDAYHFREKRVYRTYINSDVLITFEILRPLECDKEFDNLLAPKLDSKYMVKVFINRLENLDIYLSLL
jgi:hypothetical protein